MGGAQMTTGGGVVETEDGDLARTVLDSWRDPRPAVAAARDVIARLAEDDRWPVRQAAARLAGELLGTRFERVYTVFEDWAGGRSPRLRRAVAVAVYYAAGRRVPAWGTPLMHLLKRLLCDRDPYVRHSVGPLALGAGMLRYYPCLTLAKLRTWSQHDDEQARWNVAMALSAAEAAHHLKDALEILAVLAQDERHYVWRAVAAALKSLGRRQGEAVRPVIRGWLDDARRARPAAVALRLIT